MTFLDFLSPLFRKRYVFLGLWGIFSIIFIGLLHFLPSYTKANIYFSVKPLSGAEQSFVTEPAEASEKLAETIAGWASDPGFRTEILEAADTYIPNFKRKISARKQNRLNVFWTLNFVGEAEKKSAEKIVNATALVLKNNIEKFNAETPFVLSITPLRISYLGEALPYFWIGIGIVIASFFLSAFVLYFEQSVKGKILFVHQVTDLFPETPLIKLSQKIGKHDERLLEQFILTFDSPRLVGTFPRAEKHFSLAPRDSINEDRDTPVLLIKMGETNLDEVQNLSAIFGDEIAIVIFKQ